MINETLGKQNFQSLFKQVYQQTVSILSLESQAERLSMLGAVKNFEANYVYNWQRFLYPILNGPETSTFNKYTGLRSAPWAEYDVLDPERGGISGWTLTAEPWATETGLPCLWDGTRGQPNSITGALYCLSARIDAIILEEFEFEPYDDTELRSLIQCNDLNIRTLYKDIYACDIETNCSGNERLQFSFQRHLYEIFSQIISGGPDLSGDFGCEESYPELFLNISTCDISWDPNCPLVELTAGSIANGATIKLENNSVAYDNVDMIGTGSVTVSYNSTTQQIEINGVANSNTTYTIGTSTLNQSEVQINLTDSNAVVDSVSLVAGQNITITESNDRIEISSTDTNTQNTYDNSVAATANGVELELNENGSKVDGTSITGAGGITVSRVSDSEIQVEGSNSIVGAIDSKSILGQNAISPIRAVDYYAQLDGAECCYEYTYNVTTPAIIDRVVNSGTVRSTANPSANISGRAQFSGEYILADGSVQGGRGMSVSFWLNKPHLDWVSTNSRQVVWCAYDAANNNSIAFELYLGYPKNHPGDPEYANTTSSQGQDMNEHLVLYAATHTGFLYRLIDITEEGFHGTWKHFAITFDLNMQAGSAVSLYVDGVLYSNALSLQLNPANVAGMPTFDSYSLFGYPVAPWRGFGGAIEDFVIYSNQLTQAEVTSIYGQREYESTPNVSAWVNGKVAEWWQLGEDPIFGSLIVGDAIPSALTINSRVNGQSVDGITRTGTQITFSSAYTLFNLVGHQWLAQTTVVSGNAARATGDIHITQDGVTQAAVGWTVSIPRVIDEVGSSNTRVEYVTFESTTNASLNLKQDTSTYNYYFYISTAGSQADAIYSLYQAVINAGFNTEFSPTVGTDNTILQLTARDYGSRFNQPILKSDFRLATTSNFAGGASSGIECIEAVGPGVASGYFSFKADFTNGELQAGSKVTLISTDQTSITYKCVSDSSGLNTGDLDAGEVVFLNGDSLTDSDPNVQTQIRFEAALDNVIAAINSSNGHNANGAGSRFILVKSIQKSTYRVYLTQALYGAAGNTAIATLSVSPNPSNTVTAVDFTGGSDSVIGEPDNLEEYTQEAFLNRWECTSQTIDLTVGKRYEIQLSGYNMLNNQSGSTCYDTSLNLEDNIENMFESIFGQIENNLRNIWRPVVVLNGNDGHVLEDYSSQDVAGISLVIRPENACIEDPRNIYFTPEYASVPEYIRRDYYESAQDDYEIALGAMNKLNKSSVLAKNGFRSFYGKWKAKISLTVGESSVGDADKVNLYFKGEGIELDLFEYSKTSSQIIGTAQLNMSELESQHANTLTGKGGVPRERFDFELKNPFRHRYYNYGTSTIQYGLEDFNNRLKSNVVENVPVANITEAQMNSGTHYYVRGTVASVNANGASISLAVGDSGWFTDVVSTQNTLVHGGAAVVEFTLSEFPNLTFYTSELIANNCPVDDANIAGVLSYYNAAYLQGVVNYRLFEIQDCEVEAYNTLEIVTWGIDSGRWGSNPIGVLGGASDSPKDYYPPDGLIDVNIHLEEFSIKEFESTSLCEFEGINPFASFDLGLSGGIPLGSECEYCPSWEVANANSYSYTDGNGTAIVLENGKYTGVVGVSGGGIIQRSVADCDYEYCVLEIIQDSYLPQTTLDGYGYLVQDQEDYETSNSTTMTTTPA